MRPALRVLALYGHEGDEAKVWFRAIWSGIIGYVNLNHEYELFYPIDARRSLDLLVLSFTAGLSRRPSRPSSAAPGGIVQ